TITVCATGEVMHPILVTCMGCLRWLPRFMATHRHPMVFPTAVTAMATVAVSLRRRWSPLPHNTHESQGRTNCSRPARSRGILLIALLCGLATSNSALAGTLWWRSERAQAHAPLAETPRPILVPGPTKPV